MNKEIVQIKHRFTDEIIFTLSVDVKIGFVSEVKNDAYLRNANLRNAYLCNADLRNAYLRNANLRNADLSHAYLRHADLRHADLCNADLRNADLRNVNLSHAYLCNADLCNADLSHADLRNADLCNARGLIAFHFCGFSMYVQEKYTQIGCQYRTNNDWLKTTKTEAIKLGIKPKHYDIYKLFLETGIKALTI